MTQTASLSDLIAGCRSNDRIAQECVFRTFRSDFLKICLRYAADRQTADAMLSDAFFKIFTKISQYSGEGSFEGWMRRIVVNTCLAYLRSNSPKHEPLLPDGADALPDGSMPHDYNEAMSRLGMQELIRMIQCLPPTTRAVFNLYVFEGFAHKEIAAQLNMSEGTSYWHLNSARSWLKSKLIKAPRDGQSGI